MKHYQIALDGPAGAGKSTLAKKLAAQLDFIYINSGGIYRSIAVALRDNNTDITDLKEVAKVLENSRVVQKGSRMFLNGQDINDRCYTQDIQNFVPLISPIHIIREASTKSQILTAANNNIVIEGRDTTTVVFPNATLKVFVTASQELRAQRR
jgi:cytidylate kinase